MTRAAPFDLVVFLHGAGATGATLARLGPLWRRRLPGLVFVGPDGPQPFDQGEAGRQWYSVKGLTAEGRVARVAAAAPAFDAIVDTAMATHGAGSERTVLVGFSQGTIMALDAVARGRRFAGVIGYAGRLVRPPDRPLDGLPIRLVHGEADAVIAVADSEAAHTRLAAAGARVDLVRLPGEGHGIGPAAVAAGLEFLGEPRGAGVPRRS